MALVKSKKVKALSLDGPVCVSQLLDPSVTPLSTTVDGGAPITFTTANAAGYAGDWVGLYNTNAPDGNYLAWQFLNGATIPPAVALPTALLHFTAPNTPGTYNVRLFANDGGSIKVATSSAITVLPPAAPSVTSGLTTVAPGSLVTVTVANGAGYVGDWVGMHPGQR